MKYVKEIVIIFGITMVGELLNMFIPLPVPAGVYGLFILLGGLCTKVISLSDVEVTGNLLLDLMPVMFIPAGVGLMSSFSVLRPVIVPVCVITLVTVVTVMVATGRCSQWIIRREQRKEEKNK